MSKHFTIIITSYNCAKWIQQCLESAFSQDYDNYDILLVDANSTDNTRTCISMDYMDNKREEKNVCYSVNDFRKYQAENILTLVKMAKEGTICVSLDGDDMLAHTGVLKKLNEVYNDNVWLTYGSYKHHDNSKTYREPIGFPNDVIKNSNYRNYSKQLYSHLRTFRRELFLKINEEDLKVNGKFVETGGDYFFAYPMLEMAGERQVFIPDVLYIYNRENPLNDDKTNADEQYRMAQIARKMPNYQRLEKL